MDALLWKLWYLQREPHSKALEGSELRTCNNYNPTADRDLLLDDTSGSQEKAEEELISFIEEVYEKVTIAKAPSCELGERATESPMVGED